MIQQHTMIHVHQLPTKVLLHSEMQHYNLCNNVLKCIASELTVQKIQDEHKETT